MVVKDFIEIDGSRWVFQSFEEDGKKVKRFLICGGEVRFPEVRGVIEKFFREKGLETGVIVHSKYGTCIAVKNVD